MEFLLLVPILILALLLWQEKRETRVREDAWRLERSGLLNRIQHPQLIQEEDVPEPSDTPLYVAYDDDSAHDDYMELREAGEVR
jgi:hypothetical protein